MKSLKILVGATALVVAIPLTAAAAPPPPDKFEETKAGKIDTQLVPSSQRRDKVKVIVELSDDPVAVVQAKKGKLSKAEKTQIRSDLKDQQKAVASAAKESGGTVLAQMQDAYNGVKVVVPGKAIKKLAAQPGVKAVHAVEIHTLNNDVSVPYLGVPQVWQNTGYTGKGIKVAIIDTGIDYTHADFGGPGTVEAYEAADKADTQAADPALFGPDAPRVKGGYDLVGDDYDGADPTSVPKPDPNPLDCQGHGSHVAGTTAGGGVSADGTAYTGPYSADTATKSWKVGPGVAPQADLYAYRVFGCDGSTDVTVEAIDRAVKDGVDVINMSLGSPYGTANDPSAVAATNAVGAGVVVVASSGNAGPNPYLTGSPGTGKGVISVAANDSTQTFPGIAITLADGTVIPALNANGIDPVPAGPFTVVALKDDPATAENEALGCSVAAYTSNGVAERKNQLAVSVRGTCARVAKAIYAQRAGAAAAAMIDTSASYPPYEGPITENADTGEPYTVTIPFLGVRGVLGSAPTNDGDTLVAAAGTAVTLAEQDLANPAFSKIASFSSGGPRTGDSGFKPGVTAPGVSTRSAAVGTGNGVAVMSGTSMAAPHVAGVAALNVQAHPTWDAPAIAANLVNTADPAKISGYRLQLAGTGLVDTAQSVAGQVTAVGDAYKTTSGTYREPSLSFGFTEGTTRYTKTRTVTLTNRGSKAVRYKVSYQPAPGSRKASVRFSRSSVTVPPRGSASVKVTLSLDMRKVGSSLAGGFAFYEASGNVVFKGATELRVPYLLVPRANSKVAASLSGFNLSTTQTAATGQSSIRVSLTNSRGALAADADVYTLGLTDPRGDQQLPDHPGTDLRAVGVQSFDQGDEGDKLLVFAVNSYDRYANAARNQLEVPIDRDGDGEPDVVVFAVDSGLVRAGDADGRNEVFIYDIAEQATYAAGYFAVSPTDSSTVLLPVVASDLGITAKTGTFGYSAAVSSVVETGAGDQFNGLAKYNPWSPALTNGQYVTVPASRKRVSVKVGVDIAAFLDQRPLGVMIVVFDNHAGSPEALLLARR